MTVRAALTAIIVLAGLLSLACFDIPFMSDEDCGYSAYYAVPKDGGGPEIKFTTVEAEVLNGERNCGFRYLPTRVGKAQLRGKEMRERKGEKNHYGSDDYFYAAPADFDPKVDIVSIEMKGQMYYSQPKAVNIVGHTVYFKLKPFPPE